MKKANSLIILLAVCLLLTACQYGPGLEQLQIEQYNGAGIADEYKADYDILDKGPVSGGVLNLFTTVPDTLNPILTKNTYVSDFLGLIYEGLTALDEKQQAVPKLSDEWSVSGDGLIWNFHIRDNVKWHDGQPFTASDVEFTVQLLKNASLDSAYKPLVQDIVTCAAVDSSNFKLVLQKPNSFLPEMMTFPILPKHQFEKTDVLTAASNFKPVGTGPYVFESYSENRLISLKSNKSWWYLGIGDNAANCMYIPEVNVNVFKSADDAMGALQAGDIDVMEIDSGDFSKYRGRTDITIKKYTSRNFEMLAFNLNNPVFSDRYARKAISLAIDRDRLIDEVLPGDAQAAEVPVLPDSWISDLNGVSDDPTVLENTAPGAGTSGTVSYGTTGAAIDSTGGIASAYELPAAAAGTATGSPDVTGGIAGTGDIGHITGTAIEAKTPREALLQGGWKEGAQGYYKVIGGIRRTLRVELLVNSNNSIRVKAAQNLCSQLNQAGIPAVCTTVEWNDLLSKINASRFDMVLIGCRITQIPDISYLYSGSYLSAALPVTAENARNISGYFNKQLDAYIRAMFNETNADRKKAFYKAALRQISDDTPYIGLYFTRNAVVYGKNVRGSLKPYTWNHYNDLIRWYKPQQQ